MKKQGSGGASGSNRKDVEGEVVGKEVIDLVNVAGNWIGVEGCSYEKRNKGCSQ